MTFWCGLLCCLLFLTAAASVKVDVDELLSLNHANLTRASPLQVTAEQLRPIMRLGDGTSGDVFLVQLQPVGNALMASNEKLVLKRVRTTWQGKSLQSAIDVEKLAMESASHPFIIQLRASLKDKNDFLFITEQGCSPDLFGVLVENPPFDRKKAQFYVASIMLALEHLHSRGIVHRDVKLENVVLGTDGFPRLIDFGAAKLTSDHLAEEVDGTWRYLSPEVISKRPHGPGVDWWAVGHVMYEMLVGKHVFPDDPKFDIRNGVIEFPKNFDKDAADLIRRLLVKEPSKRLGVVNDSWKIITEHPWFAGFDWIKLLKREVKAPIDVKFLSNGACEAVIQ